MVRALAVVMLALGGVGMCQQWPDPEWYNSGQEFVRHVHYVTDSEQVAYFDWRVYYQGGFWWHGVDFHTPGAGCTGRVDQANAHTSLEGGYGYLDVRWGWFVGAMDSCYGEDWNDLEEPPEPPEPEGPTDDGWHCATGLDPGFAFCERYENDRYDVHWHTPCLAYVGLDLTPAEVNQAPTDFLQAVEAGCPLEDGPTPPTEIACTGADGLACEDTQRSILYVLQQMLHADETPPVTPPVHEIELDLGEVTVPSFDRDDPSWEGWVEPDFTDLEQDTLTARVEAGVLELRALAETKFPFGMVTWVPTGDVAGAGSCDDPQIALMGTDSRGIGWCDSAMELFLAGFGRAALAVLMTIGFGFGVVRTVSLS